MELATTGLQQQQSRLEAEPKNAARPNGQSSVRNLVDLLERYLGIPLDERSRSAAANLIQYGLSVVPGALYAASRDRVPGLRTGWGLLFGALLFLVNDELLSTTLGLAGPPNAYAASTHVRGLVGHLVLGWRPT